MASWTSKIFTSSSFDRHIIIPRLLFIIIISLLLVYMARKNYQYAQKLKQKHHGVGGIEGFAQNDRFVTKDQKETYDDFYASKYDELHAERTSIVALENIIASTQATTENSHFLDIGCGTGHLVDTLMNKQFAVKGIDWSEAMVKRARKRNSSAVIKCGDVTQPLSFDRNQFTHIMCLDFTLYEFTPEQRTTLYRIIHGWLKPNGYFVVHVADGDKFKKVMTATRDTKTPLFHMGYETYDTDTIEFPGFSYQRKYMPTTTSIVSTSSTTSTACMNRIETFVDKHTERVRKNELSLHIESISETTKSIMSCGFVIQGQIDLEVDPKHQKILIFERV